MYGYMNNVFRAVFPLVILFGITTGAGAREPEAFAVGNTEVWAIADAVGERDMSVFMADAEVIKRYVPSGKVPSGVTMFLLRAGDEIILIDTGHGRSSGESPSLLLSGLAEAGFAPENVTTVLITHMHGDHIGGLLWKDKQVFPNARVLIGRQERDFWLDEKNLAAYPTRKANFDLAKRVVDMYGDAVGVFEFGDSVAPGITALDAVGHTPGHTAFLIESDGRTLLCVGDLLHAAALQLPRPDINSTYDMIPEEARATRERYLQRAAAEDLPIAGMHLAFPGIGRVTQVGFAYHPGLE